MTPEYGLVRPFVSVQSVGGPFEDRAFVAGYQVALVETALRTGLWVVRFTVYTAVVPDCDLIAMQYGYTMTAEEWPDAPEEWSLVAFKKI